MFAKIKHEDHMQTIFGVLEDDLQDMNLGTAEYPKIMKVSVHIDGQFNEHLKALLLEFTDVLAWKYFDIKGIDPLLHQHMINLKMDAMPRVQQRYRINPNSSKHVK